MRIIDYPPPSGPLTGAEGLPIWAGGPQCEIPLEALWALAVERNPAFKGDSSAFTLPAIETIAAGSFVNIYDNGGVPSIRNADASDPLKPASGFVLSAVAPAAAAIVFRDGLNTAAALPTASGRCWLSDTAVGGYTQVAPTASGHLLQVVGDAIKGVGVFYNFQPEIVL